MRTIKTTMTFLLLSISLTSYSQLNPIKNLYFYEWYSIPNTFYILHWTPPDISLADTLVGYNIYSGNDLYRFYTDTIAGHTIPQDTSFGGEYFLFFAGGSYIHVTAVYNSNHIESIYNDSAYSGGLMTGLNNLESEIIRIEPNPVNDNSIIHLYFPVRKIEYITIYNSSGKLIKRIFLTSNSAFIRVSDLNLTSDLYFLIVKDEAYCKTVKFIKIE
jgi:hypothetical protein